MMRMSTSRKDLKLTSTSNYCARTLIKLITCTVRLNCFSFCFGILIMFSQETAGNVIRFQEVYKEGKINVDFNLYKDKDYHEKLTSAVVNTGQHLYIEAMCLAANPNVFTKIEKYWATPSSSTNNTKKLVLIENSCPKENTFPIKLEGNGASNRARIQHQVFKFRKSSSLTLHFTLTLCAEPCEEICSSRKRRHINDRENDVTIHFSKTLFIHEKPRNFEKFQHNIQRYNSTRSRMEGIRTNGYHEENQFSKYKRSEIEPYRVMFAVFAFVIVLAVLMNAIAYP